MVSINSKKTAEIVITRDWRDHKEELIPLTVAILTIAAILGIQALKGFKIQPFIILLEIGFVILLIYYILPQGTLSMIIENNAWERVKKVFGIPVQREMGRISEIDLIVSKEEKIDEITVKNDKTRKKSIKKNPFIPKKRHYSSSLQFWQLIAEPNQINPNQDLSDDKWKKIIVFERKMTSRNAFLAENNRNRKIGKALAELFQNLGVDIEFDIVLKVGNKK